MKNPAHNIYIHVPFCISKCKYCAFFSHACAHPDWDKYVTDICDEIKQWGTKIGNVDVPTIFFGGGTPSLMPVSAFQEIIDTIKNNFHILHDTEITLESNPGTIDAEKLHGFVRAGVNRLSIGVQSFDDEKLKFLGRQHDAQTAIQLIKNAMDIGLRVSGDFIYGIPGETVDDVIKTCKQINEIGLTHCSLYELTIEPDTPFGKMKLKMPDNNTMAQMYMAIEDTLVAKRYEVSNYAVPGHECQHNQNVWDGRPYIGIGNGAAGRVLLNNEWFEQRGANAQFDKIDNKTRAIENIITGIRTVRGCQLTDMVKNVINMDWVKNNKDKVQIENNRIKATKNGMMVLDDMIVNLVKEI